MTRILVVDASANLRLLYRLELEAEGYDILVAESGGEALDILAREKIDAIVLELLLPDCFGSELSSEILTRQRHLPFIINTAYAQFRDNFRGWGAEVFIVKSSDLSELKWALKQIISSRLQEGGKQPARIPAEISACKKGWQPKTLSVTSGSLGSARPGARRRNWQIFF